MIIPYFHCISLETNAQTIKRYKAIKGSRTQS
nr:MAG TPA: hypothetical protein [Caudoviricetes sp.]